MATKPHLPKNRPGAWRVMDRRVISGLLQLPKVSCRWCDCQVEYSLSPTVYDRSNR